MCNMNPESYRGQIPTSRILLQFNCILRKNAARYRTWGRTGRSTPVRRRRVCQTRRTVLSGGVHRTGLVLQFHSQCNCQGNVGFPYIINRVTDSKELVSAAAHREYRFKKKAGLGDGMLSRRRCFIGRDATRYWCARGVTGGMTGEVVVIGAGIGNRGAVHSVTKTGW